MNKEDLISKFTNGEDRFRTDPLFHAIIYSLLGGEDPLKIIDNLLKSNNEILDKLRNQLLK
jgi:hypothetical protein